MKTVTQLIDELRQCDPDAEVCVQHQAKGVSDMTMLVTEGAIGMTHDRKATVLLTVIPDCRLERSERVK